MFLSLEPWEQIKIIFIASCFLRAINYLPVTFSELVRHITWPTPTDNGCRQRGAGRWLRCLPGGHKTANWAPLTKDARERHPHCMRIFRKCPRVVRACSIILLFTADLCPMNATSQYLPQQKGCSRHALVMWYSQSRRNINGGAKRLRGRIEDLFCIPLVL